MNPMPPDREGIDADEREVGEDLMAAGEVIWMFSYDSALVEQVRRLMANRTS